MVKYDEVSAILFYVHIHCIGTWNSIALIHQNVRGPTWLSGKVFDWYSRGPGFEPYNILLVFRGSVLGQDTSEPQLSTGETQERYE